MQEGGWNGLDCPEEYGGQGMPYILGTAVGEIFVSANMAFNMYQGLTHGAYLGDPRPWDGGAEEDLCCRRWSACDWTGTMNLTEPHCGTDLGLMRTKAEPQADGSYRITGQKIFISAGDHDLAENIDPPRAGQGARRRRGHQGHLALHRAEVPGRRGRRPRARATRCRSARSKRRWASTATPPA